MIIDIAADYARLEYDERYRQWYLGKELHYQIQEEDYRDKKAGENV